MSAIPLPGSDQPDLNQGPHILGAVISTTVCALVVVCARLFVRLRMTRSIGTDVRNRDPDAGFSCTNRFL